MGAFNATMLELLTEQKLRELHAEFERLHQAADAPMLQGAGLRGAVASTLVRWGLRLDPAAGERLGVLDLAPVASKGGRRS